MGTKPAAPDVGVTPTRAEQSTNTAPTMSATDEIAQLRHEVSRLTRMLEERGAPRAPAALGANGATEIPYHGQPHAGALMSGITGKMLKEGVIRGTDTFPYLPRPSTDLAQLQKDFMRWGYCVVKDALSPAQVEAQLDRLIDQAAAERAAKVAMMSHRDRGQTIGNLMAKGQVLRDVVAFEKSACQGGPIVEDILGKALGPGYYCGTAHGSIVHRGGGLQDMHQDQGYVPLPHPPYPLAVLIIWTLSPFSLESGGTYVIPGSHVDEHGQNLMSLDTDFESLCRGEPGLCALTLPPGQCFIMDARVLHSGGKRTLPGTRYGMRNLYVRGFMRHQENSFLGVPDDVILKSTAKVRSLMGFRPHMGMGMVNLDAVDPQVKRVPIGELSMSRPEEFDQDFDFKHSQLSRNLAKAGSKFNEFKSTLWQAPRAKL